MTDLNMLQNLIRESKHKKSAYSNLRVKILIVKYQKKRRVECRNEIVSLCYPIIFRALKSFGTAFNTQGKLFDHYDLFQESILITIRCIEGYDPLKKTRFITYLWGALIRGWARYCTNNLVRFSKHQVSFEDYDSESNEYNYNEETLDKLFYEFIHDFDEEKEFIERLSDEERKFLDFKMRKKSIETIMKTMKIGRKKYYMLLDGLRKKFKEEVLND